MFRKVTLPSDKPVLTIHVYCKSSQACYTINELLCIQSPVTIQVNTSYIVTFLRVRTHFTKGIHKPVVLKSILTVRRINVDVEACQKVKYI